MAGVHKTTSKGRTYVYAWRGGPRIMASPDTPEFLAELAAHITDHKAPDRRRMSGLIAHYKAAPDWLDLADKTRRNWSPWLDRIVDRFGPNRVAVFDDPQAAVWIRKWRDAWRSHPRSADMGLQVMSRVLSFARAEGLISANPCQAVKRLYRSDRAAIIWTSEDMARLKAVASPEVFRVAQLALLTGLRQGDLLRLSWGHIGPSAIDIPTGKSKGRQRALVPLYADLRAALDAIPRRATTVLVTTRGLPWRSGFGASWQTAIKAAGVDKHFHDLKGSAVTRMNIAGFTDEEIAATVGWSVDQVKGIIRTYVTRDAILERLAHRLENAR